MIHIPRSRLLQISLALGGVATVLCTTLLILGHRFAERTAFNVINSIAVKNKEFDDELISYYKNEQDINATSHRLSIEQVLADIARRRGQYICIDKATKAMFSHNQREELDKSLKSYYPLVVWGEENIPVPDDLSRHELSNGYIFGISTKVYPGIVRINYGSWSGLLRATSRTEVYIWNGLGFRLHKESFSRA